MIGYKPFCTFKQFSHLRNVFQIIATANKTKSIKIFYNIHFQAKEKKTSIKEILNFKIMSLAYVWLV